MKKILFVLLVLLFAIAHSQEQKSDTLFIKYDEKILRKSGNPNDKTYNYFFENSNSEEEWITLTEVKIFKNLTVDLPLKTFDEIFKEAKVHNSFCVTMLFDYFIEDDYNTYFLVKRDEFIEVNITHSIE